jgi:hypothetical protein
MSVLKVNTINDASGGSNAVLYGVAAPANSMGFRNRIINGDMRIDQRNAGAALTVNNSNNFFAVDRFSATGQVTDGVFTVQQSTTAPAGFNNSLLATVTTADASVGAAQYYVPVRQKIEGLNVSDLGWGTANAKTVTLSFWVRCSVTGTFGGAVTNNDQNRSYPFTYTISAANTWELETITIPGDTSGTWLTTNGTGFDILWSIGMGSTFSGTAGAWAGTAYLSATGATNLINTSGATFYITGVQLEAGSVASPFERRDYGRELIMCQRYLPCFDASNGFATAAPVASAFVQSSTVARAVYVHKTPTRVPPTGITVTSPTSFIFAAGTGFVASAVAFSFAGVDASLVDLTVSGATTGQGGYVYGGASTCKIVFTGCEL